VASTLDRTLVDSSLNRQGLEDSEDNDDTLADSLLESMQSCKDTLVRQTIFLINLDSKALEDLFQNGNGDDEPDDPTLHSCAETLADSDEEFFSEQVESSRGRASELLKYDDDTPTVSLGKK